MSKLWKCVIEYVTQWSAEFSIHYYQFYGQQPFNIRVIFLILYDQFKNNIIINIDIVKYEK